jgi:hypothetical protein
MVDTWFGLVNGAYVLPILYEPHVFSWARAYKRSGHKSVPPSKLVQAQVHESTSSCPIIARSSPRMCKILVYIREKETEGTESKDELVFTYG